VGRGCQPRTAHRAPRTLGQLSNEAIPRQKIISNEGIPSVTIRVEDKNENESLEKI